jgi:hypothetical protein
MLESITEIEGEAELERFEIRNRMDCLVRADTEAKKNKVVPRRTKEGGIRMFDGKQIVAGDRRDEPVTGCQAGQELREVKMTKYLGDLMLDI